MCCDHLVRTKKFPVSNMYHKLSSRKSKIQQMLDMKAQQNKQEIDTSYKWPSRSSKTDSKTIRAIGICMYAAVNSIDHLVRIWWNQQFSMATWPGWSLFNRSQECLCVHIVSAGCLLSSEPPQDPKKMIFLHGSFYMVGTGMVPWLSWYLY